MVPIGQDADTNVLTPVLLRRWGPGWLPRTSIRVAPDSRWLDWPRRPWWSAAGGHDRAESRSLPLALILLRRGRSSATSTTYRTASERSWTIRTIGRPQWRPVAEAPRRVLGRGAAETPVRAAPLVERRDVPAPGVTITVLRPIAGRDREFRESRLLRVESTATQMPGPAGRPGSPGLSTTPVVVRRVTVAAPAPATPVVAEPMPFPPPRIGPVSVGSQPGSGPDIDLEEITARVLRSIERRAIAQRERMGRD